VLVLLGQGGGGGGVSRGGVAGEDLRASIPAGPRGPPLGARSGGRGRRERLPPLRRREFTSTSSPPCSDCNDYFRKKQGSIKITQCTHQQIVQMSAFIMIDVDQNKKEVMLVYVKVQPVLITM
jgi:hypothetical protein